MSLIKIGHHKVLFDKEFRPIISQYKWHVIKSGSTHYAMTNVYFGGKQTVLPMHRLITGMRGLDVDHRNCNGLDNRTENIRLCPREINQINRRYKNSLGFRGVARKGKKYFAQLSFKYKRHTSGCFDTSQEAARAYDKMAIAVFGEYARCNFKS